MNVFGLNEQLTSEEAKKLRKNDLKNLLTSYADEADVFSEILQNAFDATLTAISSKKYTSKEQPLIKIFIGRRQNDTHYFAVNDNGIGMNPVTMSKFTIPGFSHLKQMGKSIGYKGVGASFFFASSERISVQSKDATGRVSSFSVKGSYSWIMNETEPEPVVSDKVDFPEAILSNIADVQGTTVCYYLHNSLKPKSLNNIVIVGDSYENELKNWVNFFCIKTAIGQVKDISHLNIKVKFILDTGGETYETECTFGDFNKETKTLGYPFPWRVFAVQQEIALIDATPPAQSFKHKNKHQALHIQWSKADIQAMEIDFNEEESELINAHLDFVDLFFSYSTDVLKEVHRRLGTRTTLLRYGIRIVVDNVPQGRMMDFDLTSLQGLNRQTHAVIAFKGLELDTGRKIPSNEIITEVIRKIGVRIMNKISDYRWCLRKKDRPPISSDLDEWRNSVRSKTTTSTVRKLFELKELIPPIFIDPESENDAIALFTSCVCNKLLKGYKLFALSGFARYDGLIDIEKDDAELKDINDIFSYRDSERIQAGQLKVIEFKHQFADLLEDFEQRKKNPTEIDLAVCWTLPAMNVTRGEIMYCYNDRKDHRPLYGVTHIWTDENETSTIPIISLRHFIAEHLKEAESEPGLGAATFNTLLQQDKDSTI